MHFMTRASAIMVAAMFVAGPAVASESPPAKTGSEKRICKTETVVGSLIPGPRRCHTRAEWEEHARAGQAIARHLVEDNTGRPTTN